MKRFFLLLITSFVFHINGFAATVSDLYVFGDSLSDNGNMFSLSQHSVPSAPYYDGHFSNGKVWVEYLTLQLGLPPSSLHDAAFGGSLTDGAQPPGLIQQSQRYLDQHLNLDSNGLYIVWSGANNYLYMDSLDDAAIGKTINDIELVVNKMVERGARNLLVINLPPMNKTPWANMIDTEEGSSNYSSMLKKATERHNEKLLTAIKKLQAQYRKNRQLTRLIFFDAHKTYQAMSSQPSYSDITNFSEPCYTGDLFGRNGLICADPEHYLFWDTVHPTTQVHEKLARAILDELIKNGFATQNILAEKYAIEPRVTNFLN